MHLPLLPLTEATNQLIDESQGGTRKGDACMKSILDLDANAIIAAAAMLDCYILLIDMKSPFPSLCRKYLALVMKYAGIPQIIRRAVMALYQDNIHRVISGSMLFSELLILISSGVRQGCPMSACLFTLGLLPFVNALKANAQPSIRCLRTWLDDMTIIFQGLAEIPNTFEGLFWQFENVSGLVMNSSKTFLQPLFETTEDDIRNRLERLGSTWDDIQIAKCARCLGAYFGKGAADAADAAWTEPLIKTNGSNSDIVRSNIGFTTNIRHHNTYTVSQLQYVAQFYEPTPEVLKQEKKLIGRLMVGPRGAVPVECLLALWSVGSRIAPQSIFITAIAAKIRLYLTYRKLCDSLMERVLAATNFMSADEASPTHLDHLWWVAQRVSTDSPFINVMMAVKRSKDFYQQAYGSLEGWNKCAAAAKTQSAFRHDLSRVAFSRSTFTTALEVRIEH